MNGGRVLVAAGFVACAAMARAQAPQGAATLSPAAVAESLAVLRQLDSVIALHPADAASWYRRGMIGWALYERDRNKPPIAGLDWTRLGYLADTSLRLAAELDPSSGNYSMMAGRYLLSSGGSIARAGSYALFDHAVAVARTANNPRTLAETAVEAGRAYWRRYDGYAHRWMMNGNSRPQCNGTEAYNATLDVKPAAPDPYAPKRKGARMTRSMLQAVAGELPASEVGEADYIQAEQLFREAFTADPTFERAFRQFAMLLAERDRWNEIASAARVRLIAVHDDAWAWLALGLATHRQHTNPAFAAAAFDTALALLSPGDRARLDRLERVLKPKDSAQFAAANASNRAAYQNLYWRSADQLWSQVGNEPRSEFLARVTYAELRWTVEELNVRGADTDRGDVHIRYGPPDLIAVFPPIAGEQPDSGGVPTSDLCTLWAYDIGMTFYFHGALTFGTQFIPPIDQAAFGEIAAGNPVRFDNVNKGYRIDQLPTQAVRFRAGDSVDVMIATLPPADSIRKMSDVVTRVRSDLWIVKPDLQTVARDSLIPSAASVTTFTHRVATGAYFFRAEASADGSRYAARANAPVMAMTDTATGFRMRGFSMSDVLIATRADPRGAGKRWNDFDVSPLVGPAAQKSPLALVWENYELADQNGAARYTVTLLLERQHSAAGRIAVQVTGALARSVGVQRADDRITMQFERSVAYAPTLVDNVQLSLGDTPAGTYRLTLIVADHGSGRTTSRSAPLVISP